MRRGRLPEAPLGLVQLVLDACHVLGASLTMLSSAALGLGSRYRPPEVVRHRKGRLQLLEQGVKLVSGISSVITHLLCIRDGGDYGVAAADMALLRIVLWCTHSLMGGDCRVAAADVAIHGPFSSQHKLLRATSFTIAYLFMFIY